VNARLSIIDLSDRARMPMPSADSQAWITYNGETYNAADHLAADLSEVLLEAMRNHLVSDVPVLIFLSGGTDSACLAALARAAGAQNLSAMTVGFGEAEFDESPLTRRTAEALGVPLEVVKLEARRVEADLDHAVWAIDEPSVDGLNSYWISKLGAEAGFKVALSGQGGDELFGGYESLAWFERFDKVARWAKPLPPVPFGRLLDQDAFPFRWRKLSYLIGADDPFVAAQLAVKVLFLDRDVRELVSPLVSRNGRHSEAREHLAYWSHQVEKEDLRERLAFMDIHTHLEPRLLRDLDAMSMAHSIEVRPVFSRSPRGGVLASRSLQHSHAAEAPAARRGRPDLAGSQRCRAPGPAYTLALRASRREHTHCCASRGHRRRIYVGAQRCRDARDLCGRASSTSGEKRLSL
jgi:asparagine synthetase B (glutamine-hydrolysing)